MYLFVFDKDIGCKTDNINISLLKSDHVGVLLTQQAALFWIRTHVGNSEVEFGPWNQFKVLTEIN